MRHVIARAANHGGSVLVDIEEGDGLVGSLALGSPLHALAGAREKLVRLGFSSKKHAVEAYPFQAPQRGGLVAGEVGKHDETQVLELLTGVRPMVDHGVLQGDRASKLREALVVRGAV